MPLTYLFIGFAAGILAGLFGIGGGLLIVPALVVVAHMPIKEATGTSLGALLLPVGLLGAIVYWRDGHMNVKAALLVAGGLFVGAYLGALLNQELRAAMLTRMFALLMAVVAVRLWFSA
ncbi:MAG TPA: sulfite exporter TauE/SafE family protein [Gemmatimonadales bacterium]|nr:sulfite exporter TauE/SafE family protein [Gemmatimonadales bacterium]